MPLTMAKEGEENVIKKIGGREEIRRFLESLGFVTGGTVTVISVTGGKCLTSTAQRQVFCPERSSISGSRL